MAPSQKQVFLIPLLSLPHRQQHLATSIRTTSLLLSVIVLPMLITSVDAN
jgi:hypothetical protein